jgi:hypothetical protein
MFDVTTFLIRWLFLSNLARDVAEIQTLPCKPYYPHQHQQQPHDPIVPRHRREEQWRDDCIRGILSYPPGQQRLFVMDAIRIELVQQLAQVLRRSSDTLKRSSAIFSGHNKGSGHGKKTAPSEEDDNGENDPFLDADVEILETFGQTATSPQSAHSSQARNLEISTSQQNHQKHAALVLSRDGTNVIPSDGDDASIGGRDVASSSPRVVSSQRIPIPSESDSESPPPSVEEIKEARANFRDMKEYLPQLTAAVLRSPPSFDLDLSNPVQKLRQLLLRRCVDDPGFGIDLCWLLEAEVGRAWKTLFEHRQQTGRRLIVVLPAEKAAVLAKIGNEKRGAFDLLQDAEQATAYGYTFDHERLVPSSEADENEDSGVAPRLPSSLSLRRCSHFGDTMHFVDRLTKVSLDLRVVPPAQRQVCDSGVSSQWLLSPYHHASDLSPTSHIGLPSRSAARNESADTKADGYPRRH